MQRHRLAALRRSRGYSQESLAHRLEVERTTVGRWERGEAAPYPRQRSALAEALGVTEERLDALIDEAAQDAAGGDDLAATVSRLEATAVAAPSDEQRQPVLRLLGYAYQAIGCRAFDRLDFADATGHFHSAQEIGADLGDPDMIAAALTQLGDVARRERRYGTALRLIDSAERHAATASVLTQVLRCQTLARAHAELGERPAFDRAIGRAEELARRVSPEHHREGDYSPRGVRLERGQGLTVLGSPAAALAIYAECAPPEFRSDRERGSFVIIHAQALAGAGQLDEGVRLAIEGLGRARAYGSARHVSRVQRMYDRLATAVSPSEPDLVALCDALAA